MKYLRFYKNNKNIKETEIINIGILNTGTTL